MITIRMKRIPNMTVEAIMKGIDETNTTQELNNFEKGLPRSWSTTSLKAYVGPWKSSRIYLRQGSSVVTCEWLERCDIGMTPVKALYVAWTRAARSAVEMSSRDRDFGREREPRC